MLRRILIFSLLFWAVLAVPSLCRAGALEHACECGIAGNCGHEDDCTSDPCAVAKPAPETRSLVQAVIWAPCMLGPSPVIDRPVPATLDSWARSSHERFTVPPSLRCGARPLLV